MTRKVLGTFAAAVAAPIAGHLTLPVLFVAAAFAGAVFGGLVVPRDNNFPEHAPLPFASLFTLAAAALLAVLASRLGRRSAVTGAVPLALMLALPIGAGLLVDELRRQTLARASVAGRVEYSLAGVIGLWALCLAVVLVAAGGLRRHHVLAWLVGIAGTIAITDLTVALAASISGRYAFASAMPHLFESFRHGFYPDYWGLDRTVYMLLCSGYALGYVLGPRRA